MRTPVIAATIVVTITSATPALADTTLAASAAAPAGERRTEVDIGFLLGSEEIGDDARFARGIQVDVGRRFGDLVLLAEYNYLGVGRRNTESTGSLSRVGAVARYSLLRTGAARDGRGRRKPVSGDVWLEAGGGVQRIAWDRGGRLIRPDAVLGFGWQVDGVIGRREARPRYYGPYIAFRAHLARAPEHPDGVMPTCGGPCDRATRPSRNNVGLFFHAGVHWGR